MTLVARPKPHGPTHKKRTGQHHRRSHQYVKTYWPYLPMLLIVGAGLLLNSAWPATKHSVLGYATDMSVQELFDGTNAQRAANGEGNLNINSQLDAAAQAKANDMVARDYWSHNTPDGQTPWTFITNAGYAYTTAGENLAYGFATASDTITGWMNSAEHRANILNTSYKDVGFGIANSPNYQGSGPETVVVAMYGSPASGSVAAATPAQSTPVQIHSPTTATPTPVATPAPVSTQPTTTPSTSIPVSSTPSTKADATKPAAIEPASRPVARVQLLTGGEAPWSAFAISLIMTVAILAFALRHGFAWRKVWVKSEVFVMHHPMLDTLFVVIATLGFVLTRSAGIIK